MTTGFDTTVSIMLKFPPRGLSPNARLVWQAKAPVVAAYRKGCRVDALNVRRDMERREGIAFPLAAPVVARITFILADNQLHDWDNLIASFKSGMDGIRDAGIISDDSTKVIGRLDYGWRKGENAGVLVRLTGAPP